MAFFNRLTDIVTCNLTTILADAADPAAALSEIVREIREGIAGAERCVATASRNMTRVESEIAEQKLELVRWGDDARRHLEAGHDDQARQSLFRKREVADLMAALEEQHRAATATRDHLLTTLNALQARLVDAQRRLANLQTPVAAKQMPHGVPEQSPDYGTDENRRNQVERELEELRKSLSGG